MAEADPNMLTYEELAQIKGWLGKGPLLPEIRDDMRALFIHIDAQAAEIDRLRKGSLKAPPSGEPTNE